MVKISVIIPVYNVENYLNECLDSVVNQTLSDIEIICVNDGSTDNSLNILKQYSKSDNRIKIINQNNLGVSSARNNGLDVSVGKYICFLDSDDYLELDALEKVYDVSESNGLDICLFKLINFDDDTKKQYNEEYFDMTFLKKKYGSSVFSHNDIESDLFRISVTPHSKLFNREFISQFKFPEGLIYEDNVFFTQAMFEAGRVLFYDEYLYNRRIRQNSITHSGNEKCIDWIEIFNILINITKDYGYYDKYKSVLYYKAIFSSYNIFKDLDEKYKQDFFIKLKKDFEGKKSEWLNEDSFINSEKRLQFIFNECLSSNNHIEFELKVELFDANKLDNIDMIDIPLVGDNFNLDDKNQFIEYINSYKRIYHLVAGSDLTKFALKQLISLTYKIISSNLSIKDKIDILQFIKPLYIRMVRIKDLLSLDDLEDFIGLVICNKFLEALNLFDNNMTYPDSSDNHEDVFLLFWGLHEEIGGLAKAVCDRANLFNKNGYSVKLLNIDSFKNVDYIIDKYYNLGFISNSIEIINIYDYYSKKNTINFNYSPLELSVPGKEDSIKKIENTDYSVTLQYFNDNECSINNLIKEEIYVSGYMALKKLFNEGEVIKEYYYTCDDFNYLYVDYENNDILLFDRTDDFYISFENIEEFQDYFVTESCLKSCDKPFLINDCSSRYPSIKNIECDVAYKIGVVHNNPYFKPYCYGASRWNIASLNDIEDEDVVVVLTESSREDFIKEFNMDNFCVIPNFVTDANLEKSLKEYPKDENIISIFARISVDKNIGDLIKAFNMLLKQYPDAVLKIYGRAIIPDEITERKKLEDLAEELGISDSVKFMGHVDNVYEEMSKSLVTVLCSNIEGFGLVIIESMINFTPVISYDTNYGPSDIIVDDINGFIVDQFDIDGLYEKLLFAFENPKKIHEMGKLAREHVLNNFTEEIVFNKWENLFKDLISKDY